MSKQTRVSASAAEFFGSWPERVAAELEIKHVKCPEAGGDDIWPA